MEFKNKPYRLVPLSRIIVCKMYYAHVNDDPKLEYSVSDIVNLFSLSVSLNLITSAMEFLRGPPYRRENALVTRHKPATAEEYTYRLTQNAILMVERHLRNKDSDVAHYFERGDDAIFQEFNFEVARL